MITRLSYAQLLETNWMLQHTGDITYWQCVTRTTQESKLFPVPAYMMLSYANAFYRYPSLLRKIEHRLQIMFDLQTHTMPEDDHELRRLAIRSGYSDAGDANARWFVVFVLQSHLRRDCVRRWFRLSIPRRFRLHNIPVHYRRHRDVFGDGQIRVFELRNDCSSELYAS